MARSVLAMEVIPVLRAQMRECDEPPGDPVSAGRRAALWRAQQHAARLDRTLADLRRFCLDGLARHRMLDDESPTYLRGYREGLQAVLREIRRLEGRA
jgi:hypothetical protein